MRAPQLSRGVRQTEGRMADRRVARVWIDVSGTDQSEEPVIIRENVTITGLQLTRVHKADLVPPRIGAQNPGNIFHLSEGRSITIRESGTRRDGEGDPTVAARKLATLNDPLMKTGSLDDRRVATGEAERSSPFLDRAPANLETHGLSSSLGAFHGYLLSVGLLNMSRHDTTALCWEDGRHCFEHFPVRRSGAQQSQEPPNHCMQATAGGLGGVGPARRAFARRT